MYAEARVSTSFLFIAKKYSMCGYATFYVSINQLLDIGVVS